MEVTKNFEKFDICHHCKLLYPENFLIKCKYSSDKMGVPIQPAPYCDPYLTQISKGTFLLMQFKLQNRSDIWWEGGTASKTTPKLGRNMSAIENFVSIASNKTMRMGLIKMDYARSAREYVFVLAVVETIQLSAWRVYTSFWGEKCLVSSTTNFWKSRTMKQMMSNYNKYGRKVGLRRFAGGRSPHRINPMSGYRPFGSISNIWDSSAIW